MQPVIDTVAALSSTTTPALTTSYAVRPVYRGTSTVEDPRTQGFGRAQAVTFAVSVTEASGGAFTGVTFKIQQSADGANPTTAAATNWNDLEIVNSSTSAAAVEHTLSVGAGATATHAYHATSTANTLYTRCLVKATGGNAGAGDSVTITATGS